MHLFSLCEARITAPHIPKLLLIMKFTAFIMLLMTLHISAESLGQKVHLDMDNVRIDQVLKEVQRQTGYAFLYSRKDLEEMAPLSLHVESKDFRDVLDHCFLDYPMEYIIEESERVVILKRLKGHKISVVEARIPERIVIGQVAVQGMITDTTGAPLIGVSVALKGRASVGTSTDLNGRFVLEIPEDGVLIFSTIGFETQDRKSTRLNSSH